MSLFMLLWSVYVEYSRKWREMVGEGCCQCYPRAGIGGIYSLAEWSLMILLLRRLEVLLDRSWEKESITWTGLTWWDPLPCGQDFVVQVRLIWTISGFIKWKNLFTSFLQVTRYLQPPLPSPAFSLLCNPPTPKLSSSHLARFPSRLQVRSLSTSYSLNEACTLANPSPESYQSVFSTSPDYAFPPTPSSSPPLLSQPCALPVGFPSPPDSVPRKVHNVLIQGSVVVIRQFLIFINQTFLMVSVALVTMVDWRVHLFSCLGPLLGPLGGPEGALEAPKMPKITISCFDYRNAPKWVEQGPKIGWTLQNTFRGVC